MSDTSFTPGPESTRAFRDALGCYGTGVAVVTTLTGNGPLAMTANSFAAVSLHPPLVLWCPALASRRHDAFAGADSYAIHIMGEDQQELARRFANSGEDFSGLDWAASVDGAPILPDCLACFECVRTAVHDAGDHSIVIGHVTRVTHRAGRGLMFKRGQYGGFTGPR